MKKTNNKGFSLVELIIVIAIMAILAGAIAPALIRYIDKSRKSNDVSSAKAIKTAIDTALGNESVYEYLTTGSAFCYIYITPGKKTTDAETPSDVVKIVDASTATEINGKTSTELDKMARTEIGTNIGEKTPKLKYKKNAADKDAAAPTEFVGVVSKNGTVYVFISTKATTTLKVAEDATTGEVKVTTKTDGFQICPNLCDEYQ